MVDLGSCSRNPHTYLMFRELDPGLKLTNKLSLSLLSELMQRSLGQRLGNRDLVRIDNLTHFTKRHSLLHVLGEQERLS